MPVHERPIAAAATTALQHDSGGDIPDEEVLPPSVMPLPALVEDDLLVVKDGNIRSATSAASVAAATTPPTSNGLKPALVRPTPVQVLGLLSNWGTCVFIIFLVVAQFCGVFWDSVDTRVSMVYGHDPTLGPVEIVGTNDAAYSDRVLACVLEGRFYKPKSINDAISASSATVVDTTGSSINGYHVTYRDSGLQLSTTASSTFSDACSLIASTKDDILEICTSVGYTPMTDALRVTTSKNPNKMVQIADALPVIIMPYWDNAPLARVAIPGSDGSACMFRLGGKYLDSDVEKATMELINRSVREAKTLEWLLQGDTNLAQQATWVNGWVKIPDMGDGSSNSFFSDLVSSDMDSAYGVAHRVFNPETRQELDCSGSTACAEAPVFSTWGNEFSMETHILKATSITSASDEHYGLFLYTSTHRRIVKSTYGWETLISNVTLSFVLGRWVVAMSVLLIGYYTGKSTWFNGGIGCVSSSRAFNVLPIALLPRLPVTLSAFWTVGCLFEGDQGALSECWFTVYPAVVEVLFIYYSVLNIVAKLARRRITDILFAPTVIALCSIHRARQQLAESGVLGVDGRVSTLVSSAEAADVSIIDFFTTDISWRLNGGITSLFAVKLVMLAVNLLPLFFAEYIPPAKQPDTGLRGVENILAIRASNVGGLGRSSIYIYEEGAATPPLPLIQRLIPCLRHKAKNNTDSKDGKSDDAKGEKQKAKAAPKPDGKLALNSYELVRLGYVVLSGQYLITIDAWDTMWTTAILRRVYYLYNHRVVLFPVQEQQNLAVVNGKPQMCRLDDDRLKEICFWKIAAQPVKC